MEYITVQYKGQSVQCWGGALQDDDNIIMAYDGGFEDIVDNHNYKTDEAFKNWKEAVKYLIDLDRFGEIEQLESC
jgi:hypothetical protein